MLSPYLVENRHVAIKRCRHGLFMYNRNDAFIGRGLDLYGEWCEFEIQLMRLVLRRATSRSMPGKVDAIALTPWATDSECSSSPWRYAWW